MINAVKKSLNLKLAGSLFLILLLSLIVFSIIMNHSYISEIDHHSDQISNLLGQLNRETLNPDNLMIIKKAAALVMDSSSAVSQASVNPVLIAGSIIFLSAMVIMGIIFQILFLKPIKTLTLNLGKSIAGNERDLTVRLSLNRKDEIGILADRFDLLLSNLDDIIMNISRKTETVAAAAAEVSIVSEQMDDESTDLFMRSNSVAAAAEEMNSSMHTVAAASEEASTNISMVAEAAGQMQLNITGVAQNCDEAKQISSDALKQVDHATGKVGTLGEAAKEIGNVTQVITEIAEQTNLLALNATIEAARAGEAGKGFAVVAGEIKNLASQTGDATQSIRKKIEGIQNSTEETVHEVGNISQVITHVDEIVTEIVTAIEGQSATATEVANNIDQASIGISEVNENVAQISQVSSEIATDISLVDHIAGEMSGRVTHMSKGAKDLDKLSLDLREKISVFKVSMDDTQVESESSLTEQDIPDIFPWSSKLVTSIDIIDTHHMELVRMVNQLHKAMRMQKGSKEVGRMLSELAEYTVFHFGFEEELFEKYAYPETDQHLRIHKDLVSKVIGFQDDFNTGKATVTMDLMSFLTDWLKNHIMKTDMKYVSYLSEKMAAEK